MAIEDLNVAHVIEELNFNFYLLFTQISACGVAGGWLRSTSPLRLLSTLPWAQTSGWHLTSTFTPTLKVGMWTRQAMGVCTVGAVRVGLAGT